MDGNANSAAFMASIATFLASFSKLLFEAPAAAFLGCASLRRIIWLAGGIAPAAGLASVWFWPLGVGLTQVY